MRLFLLLFCVFSGIHCLQAQLGDNILWTGFNMQHKVDDKWNLELQPILRLNEDFGGYLNTSIDYAVHYSFTPNWKIRLLGRTWSVPDRTDRQMIWLDLTHASRFSKLPLQWTNRMRMHLALNLGGLLDRDFIRYRSQFQITQWKAIRPVFGTELWFQTEAQQALTRYRIELGCILPMGNGRSFLLLWHRENNVNIAQPFGDNLWWVIYRFSI